MAGHPTRMPTYFMGIGGPNFMENIEHPAYLKLAEIGKEITERVQPRAIVVFSAHWQAHGNKVQVNAAEDTDLIYDFYGFPPHYYEYDFPNKGSPEIADEVAEALLAAGVEVEKVKRGLDHDVWVGFMAAFDPTNNPLHIPIVQVSLHGDDDWQLHYRLGKALAGLRDDGVLIIGAGMAVHNLREYRSSVSTKQTMPYAYTFDEALKDAATARVQDREKNLAALMVRDDLELAHPTLEHLLPFFVAAGAGELDAGLQIWTMAERSLSWAQFRFG